MNRKKKRYFYCLTFKVEFEYERDSVYFAYANPYSYSKIIRTMIENEKRLLELMKHGNYTQKESKSLHRKEIITK